MDLEGISSSQKPFLGNYIIKRVFLAIAKLAKLQNLKRSSFFRFSPTFIPDPLPRTFSLEEAFVYFIILFIRKS